MHNLTKTTHQKYTHTHYKQKPQETKFDLGRKIYHHNNNGDDRPLGNGPNQSPLRKRAEIKGFKIDPKTQKPIPSQGSALDIDQSMDDTISRAPGSVGPMFSYENNIQNLLIMAEQAGGGNKSFIKILRDILEENMSQQDNMYKGFDQVCQKEAKFVA